MNIGMIIFIVILIILIIIIIRSYIVNNNILTKLSDAKTQQTIPASSLATSSNTGSSNYAYSIWFYINDWTYMYGDPKIIFARKDLSSMVPGSSDGSSSSGTGTSGSYPQPSVSLGAISNDLIIELTVSSTSTPNLNTLIPPCTIQNIPIQQWVNFTMSIYGKTLDTYINGKLVKTCVLPGVPTISTADIIVTPNGGFDGSTAKLAYYPNSLNPEQAWNIYEDGYSGGILSNLTGSYQLNVSVLQNGIEEASLTI
jgi:hypothetical protein